MLSTRSSRFSLLAVSVLASSAAAQQGSATTSNLTSIPLYQGAVRVTDAAATRDFGKTLNSVAAQLKAGCTKSEYLVWDAKDAERIGDALLTQLERGGYKFEEIDTQQSDDTTVTFFQLTGKTHVVGVWSADAENVVLGWCQTNLKAAAPTPIPPPGLGQPRPTTPTQPAATATPTAPAAQAAPVKIQPGYIVGRVLDTQGRPLAGANVRITGTTFAQGQRTEFDTTTKTDGTYSIRVPDGRYKAKATFTKAWNGNTYGFILYPLSGDPNTEIDSTEGGVLNFQWKLSGRSAYSAAGATGATDFYGAAVEVSYCGLPARAYCNEKYTDVTPGAAPEGSTVTLTFTPRAPLVDGTVGKAITYTFKTVALAPPGGYPYTIPSGGGRTTIGADWPYHSKEFTDIPLGAYVMTATATLPDGTKKPLRLGLKDNDVEHTSVNVNFAPWDDFNPRSYIGGGLKVTKVYMRD